MVCDNNPASLNAFMLGATVCMSPLTLPAAAPVTTAYWRVCLIQKERNIQGVTQKGKKKKQQQAFMKGKGVPLLKGLTPQLRLRIIWQLEEEEEKKGRDWAAKKNSDGSFGENCTKTIVAVEQLCQQLSVRRCSILPSHLRFSASQTQHGAKQVSRKQSRK